MCYLLNCCPQRCFSGKWFSWMKRIFFFFFNVEWWYTLTVGTNKWIPDRFAVLSCAGEVYLPFLKPLGLFNRNRTVATKWIVIIIVICADHRTTMILLSCANNCDVLYHVISLFVNVWHNRGILVFSLGVVLIYKWNIW